jgi:hypothetical protein
MAVEAWRWVWYCEVASALARPGGQWRRRGPSRSRRWRCIFVGYGVERRRRDAVLGTGFFKPPDAIMQHLDVPIRQIELSVMTTAWPEYGDNISLIVARRPRIFERVDAVVQRERPSLASGTDRFRSVASRLPLTTGLACQRYLSPSALLDTLTSTLRGHSLESEGCRKVAGPPLFPLRSATQRIRAPTGWSQNKGMIVSALAPWTCCLPFSGRIHNPNVTTIRDVVGGTRCRNDSETSEVSRPRQSWQIDRVMGTRPTLVLPVWE